MTTEIKIQFEQVKKSLDNLYNSIQAFEPSFQINIEGKNSLDVVTKINDLNKKLHDANELYKEILMINEYITEQSVEFMKETDIRLSGRLVK